MGDRECYKCHRTGHMARDCPDGDRSGGGGGSRGGDRRKLIVSLSISKVFKI